MEKQEYSFGSAACLVPSLTDLQVPRTATAALSQGELQALKGAPRNRASLKKWHCSKYSSEHLSDIDLQFFALITH